VDPRTGLDDVEKRKFFILPGLGTPTTQSFSPQPVAIPTTLFRLLFVKVYLEIIYLFMFRQSGRCPRNNVPLGGLKLNNSYPY
jgi:hypothetical protein